MTDSKKKENLSESNFGHTENEWGIEKKDSECTTCDIKEKERKI